MNFMLASYLVLSLGGVMPASIRNGSHKVAIDWISLIPPHLINAWYTPVPLDPNTSEAMIDALAPIFGTVAGPDWQYLVMYERLKAFMQYPGIRTHCFEDDVLTIASPDRGIVPGSIKTPPPEVIERRVTEQEMCEIIHICADRMQRNSKAQGHIRQLVREVTALLLTTPAEPVTFDDLMLWAESPRDRAEPIASDEFWTDHRQVSRMNELEDRFLELRNLHIYALEKWLNEVHDDQDRKPSNRTLKVLLQEAVLSVRQEKGHDFRKRKDVGWLFFACMGIELHHRHPDVLAHIYDQIDGHSFDSFATFKEWVAECRTEWWNERDVVQQTPASILNQRFFDDLFALRKLERSPGAQQAKNAE